MTIKQTNNVTMDSVAQQFLTSSHERQKIENRISITNIGNDVFDFRVNGDNVKMDHPHDIIERGTVIDIEALDSDKPLGQVQVYWSTADGDSNALFLRGFS